MNLIFKKQLPRRTFLRGMGSVVALPLLDAMVPAFVQSRRLVADPPGDSVFPERRPDGHMGHQERRANRRAPGRAAAHAGAADEISQRHHRAERSDRRWRPRAWRRSRRPRPRGRELPDRRASQEDVRQGSPGRRLDGSVRGRASSAARRDSRRSSSDAKKAFRAAIATTATAAPTATASRGARPRRRIRRRFVRAPSSSACSAPARSSAIR